MFLCQNKYMTDKREAFLEGGAYGEGVMAA